MNEKESIFALLNRDFPRKWSTRNAFCTNHSGESRHSLFIELEIDGLSAVGCASVNTDFSRSVAEELMERAVRSAYIKLEPNVTGFTNEQLSKIAELQKKYDIVGPDYNRWDEYVQMWNKNLTLKDLNKDNVDGFLDYINQLENVKVEG